MVRSSMLLAAFITAQADPPEVAPPSAAEPGRLAAALRLKEERRLEESLRELEALAGKPLASSPPSGIPPPITAAAVLARLEAIDVRLRLGRLAGLEASLDALEESWWGHAGIGRRVQALQAMLRLQGRSLLEPNAISRSDLGERFRERFLAGRSAGEPSSAIPLDLPIRYLSDLSPGQRPGPSRAARARPVIVAGFLGLEDLAPPAREAWRPALEHFDRDERALLALFVYTGDSEPPPPALDEEPWSRVALFWIRGSPAVLAGAPVRSRYEWLPGPTFFLVEPGGRLRSWRWPHEGWEGFLKDAEDLLRGRPGPAGRRDRE